MKRHFFLLLLVYSIPLWAQNQPIYAGLSNDEQLSFVGMMMADLLEKHGPPRSVVADRGSEVWQDDVVFQYNGADFYIYRDRIWQVRLSSTHGVSDGDRKAVVLLTLSGAEDKGDYALFAINGKNWPLMMRINFNSAGHVAAIYIYRPDF
ncbi:MAG: hypothetical protein FWB77_04105 [Treponema sp.]|nr:hypothetical protein [Treponema sp.]